MVTQVQQLTQQYKTLQSRIKELEGALKLDNQGDSVALSHTQQGGVGEIGPEPSGSRLSATTSSTATGADTQAGHHGAVGADVGVLLFILGSLNISPVSILKGLCMIRQDAEADLWDSYDDANNLGMPPEIVELADAFPMGLGNSSCRKSDFVQFKFLPSRKRALELIELYYHNVAWLYNPITRTDFTANIFDPIYGTNENPSVDDVHAHRLSIFFVVLATGALYDRHPSAKLLAQQYNVLSRAALSLDPISREANTATVQALNLSIRFLSDFVSDSPSFMSEMLKTVTQKEIALVGTWTRMKFNADEFYFGSFIRMMPGV
ncbi:hypothetical protein HWV62_4728 [Athelia sp. TMB]|nr:hypothetical protein HWV62_4728 [Athelia sp. TMB]